MFKTPPLIPRRVSINTQASNSKTFAEIQKACIEPLVELLYSEKKFCEDMAAFVKRLEQIIEHFPWFIRLSQDSSSSSIVVHLPRLKLIEYKNWCAQITDNVFADVISIKKTDKTELREKVSKLNEALFMTKLNESKEALYSKKMIVKIAWMAKVAKHQEEIMAFWSQNELHLTVAQREAGVLDKDLIKHSENPFMIPVQYLARYALPLIALEDILLKESGDDWLKDALPKLKDRFKEVWKKICEEDDWDNSAQKLTTLIEGYE
jgi:hypothetical protein